MKAEFQIECVDDASLHDLTKAMRFLQRNNASAARWCRFIVTWRQPNTGVPF